MHTVRKTISYGLHRQSFAARRYASHYQNDEYIIEYLQLWNTNIRNAKYQFFPYFRDLEVQCHPIFKQRLILFITSKSQHTFLRGCENIRNWFLDQLLVMSSHLVTTVIVFPASSFCVQSARPDKMDYTSCSCVYNWRHTLSVLLHPLSSCCSTVYSSRPIIQARGRSG